MNNLQTIEAVKAALPNINFLDIESEHGGFAVVTYPKDKYRDFVKAANSSELLSPCVGEYDWTGNNIRQRIKLH